MTSKTTNTAVIELVIDDKGAVTGMKQTMKTMETSYKKQGAVADKASLKWVNLAAKIGLAGAALGTTNKAVEFLAEGESLRNINNAFKLLVKDADLWMRTLKEATEGTLTGTAAQRMSMSFQTVGKSAQEAGEVAALAWKLAAASGQETDAVMKMMQETFTSGEAGWTKTFGVIVDTEKISRDLAKTLGVSTDALKKEQKAAAASTVMMEKLSEAYKNFEPDGKVARGLVEVGDIWDNYKIFLADNTAEMLNSVNMGMQLIETHKVGAEVWISSKKNLMGLTNDLRQAEANYAKEKNDHDVEAAKYSFSQINTLKVLITKKEKQLTLQKEWNAVTLKTLAIAKAAGEAPSVINASISAALDAMDIGDEYSTTMGKAKAPKAKAPKAKAPKAEAPKAESRAQEAMRSAARAAEAKEIQLKHLATELSLSTDLADAQWSQARATEVLTESLARQAEMQRINAQLTGDALSALGAVNDATIQSGIVRAGVIIGEATLKAIDEYGMASAYAASFNYVGAGLMYTAATLHAGLAAANATSAITGGGGLGGGGGAPRGGGRSAGGGAAPTHIPKQQKKEPPASIVINLDSGFAVGTVEQFGQAAIAALNAVGKKGYKLNPGVLGKRRTF